MISSPYIQWHEAEPREGGYCSPKEAAANLWGGDILGLITGKGEAGPRALGNRSLLGSPTKKTAYQLSQELKKREFYRPVAPIVTDNAFDNLFSGPRGKYMQYRNQCLDNAIKLVPGVVHRDISARVQVLEYEDNPWLYETLVEFGRFSGTECLINTSLNVQGLPICNTVADAKKELNQLPVKLVYF